MGATVSANGLSIVHTRSGGVSTATLPDVCRTPPSGAPVPYPNVALSRDLERGSRSVRIDGGCPVALASSSLATSRGDEAGTLGGVGSGVNRGSATFLSHSFDVQIEGQGVCRLTDKMLHNRGNTVNCSGHLQDNVTGAAMDLGRTSTDKLAVLEVEVVTKGDDGAEHPVKRALVKVDDHGYERHARTNKEGLALFSLPPGVYRVDVHQRGFEDVFGQGRSARPKGTRKFELVAAEKPARLPAYGIHNPLRDPAKVEQEAVMAASYDLRYMRINVGIDASFSTDQISQTVASVVANIKLLAKHDVVAFPTLLRSESNLNVGPAENDPTGRANWKSFVQQLCAELKPGGAAGLPDACAIRCWEVWNEPNLDAFWQPHPDPDRYLVLLHDTREALRDADPAARIVFGGLSQITKNYDPIHFLERVAHLGGKGLFDAVAIHPYAENPATCIHTVGKVYDALKRLELTGKNPKTDVQIWITEVGWAVPNPPRGMGVLTAKDPEDLARRMEELGRLVEAKREEWRLGPLFWYCYYDYDSDITWAANCGIFDAHDRSTTPPTSLGPRKPAAKMAKKVASEVRKDDNGADAKRVLRKVSLPHLRER